MAALIILLPLLKFHNNKALVKGSSSQVSGAELKRKRRKNTAQISVAWLGIQLHGFSDLRIKAPLGVCLAQYEEGRNGVKEKPGQDFIFEIENKKEK